MRPYPDENPSKDHVKTPQNQPWKEEWAFTIGSILGTLAPPPPAPCPSKSSEWMAGKEWKKFKGPGRLKGRVTMGFQVGVQAVHLSGSCGWQFDKLRPGS
jgi:hypothetical protein